MRWSERQSAMLREIGIRLWAPDGAQQQAASILEVQARTASAEAGTKAASNERGTARPPRAEAGTTSAQPLPVSVPMPVPDPLGLDWPALREAVSTCVACTLCKSRRQTVFGVGNARAHWMIVGEAPGEQEDLQGEPFVGKSGQLLDNMLRALALSRSEGPPDRQVYIANTLKCRPPGNRNPEPAELAKCEPFLIRQLELVQPRIIVAMGRFAVQSLLRSSEPIGRLRGRVHRYRGVPLIVTYHPAYLLRNPEDKAKAWEDLCLAAESARTSP